ncbi:MAG: sulfite exporter TauE/SafE family protein [Sandaracinaceae bacterium]
MSLEPRLFALAGIVFAGYVVQTVTGFGSALVCLTFGALLYPIPEIVPLIVPLSFAQSVYIVVRHYRDVNVRFLFVRILPLMGAGVGVGMLIAHAYHGDALRYAFGGLVLVLSLRELYVALRREAAQAPLPRAASMAAIFGAGITHGVYGAGGPLLVYATSREGLEKGPFRATLGGVWLVLNAIMTTAFAFRGVYDVPHLTSLGVMLCAIPFGIAVGEVVHHRVDERRFKIGVLALLTLAALSLFVAH